MTTSADTTDAPLVPIDDCATELTRRRYDLIAPIYDALDWMMDRRARRLLDAKEVRFS